MRKKASLLNLTILAITGFLLLVPHLAVAGWSLWALGVASTLICTSAFRRHALLIYASVAILGLIPINTDISPKHMAIMGSALLLTILGPYLISRYRYKEDIIRYPLFHGRWHWWHYAYILLTATIAYLILPFWMQQTGDYLNWTVHTTPGALTMLFLGTNSLGIWDELFFVITTLALLQRHVSFKWANLAQAIIWTSFLFDLGFRSWAPPLIFLFALLQGVVFRRTHSLLYLLTIHLTLDLILYLALINAHYPHLLNIFITR